MCMDYADSKTKKRRYYGWKLVGRPRGYLKSEWMEKPLAEGQNVLVGFIHGNWETADTVKAGEWANDDKGPFAIKCFRSFNKYLAGFHTFATLKDARRWLGKGCYAELDEYKLVRCELREVVATGLQDECRVTVSKQIRVIPGIERKVCV